MREPDYIAAAILDDFQARTPAPREPLGGGFDLGAPQDWSDSLTLSPALVARLWSDGADDDRTAIDNALSTLRVRQIEDQKSNQ